MTRATVSARGANPVAANEPVMAGAVPGRRDRGAVRIDAAKATTTVADVGAAEAAGCRRLGAVRL